MVLENNMKASTVKKINHIPLIIVFSFVLIFGIIFLILSFSVLNQKIPENCVEVTAEISYINEIEIDNDFHYEVFINYSYDGQSFENQEYDKYDSSMKAGKTVTIFVNPDNPSEYYSDDSDNFVFPLIGGVVIVIGVGGLAFNIIQLIKMKRREE